ncbi:MAG: GNAT family protein [Candidatus Micrarchaeia archaeon]
MEELKLVRSGKELRKLGAKAFMDYINPIIREKAYILMDKPVTLKQEKEWLESTAKAMDAKSQMKIILFVDRKIAGVCDVMRGRYKEMHNVHFGLSVAKKHRGKGYGEMLLRKGIQAAKKYFKPHRIWIEHLEGNETARKLYEKLGFIEVARLDEYENYFGRWIDKILMRYEN